MGCLLTARDITLYTPAGLPLFYAEGFSLTAGEFLHIAGDNGSGKSTALKAFMGRYPHYSGEITRHYADERVAYLPQMGNAGFLMPMSLGDVIGLTMKSPGHDVAERVAALGLLGADELELAWNASSGGERQKALLARAFLAAADLIVLDEPFNHLDAAARQRVIALIAAARDQGTAVIAVSHDAPALAKQACHVLRTDRRQPEGLASAQHRPRHPPAKPTGHPPTKLERVP